MGVWDLGGSEACRALWSTVYKNVKISAIILVIDWAERETYFIQSRQMLHFLVNEDELRYSTLMIVVNTKTEDQGVTVEKKEQAKMKKEVMEYLDIEELPKTLDFKDTQIEIESAKNKEAAQKIFKSTSIRIHRVS